ncbi:zinc-dependent alcohol dehydrogenase [Streptomyces tsukubensis]|uniref:Alcohol dehydrogenase n=1 Tax=Streptomyces tsukubensis TaxID=83656 RepID=A0A1V4A6L6_9ACTN|nr:zinc-dependent alcohol dehydrogenase [Streptomyces tsukubensis]OON77398.1 zinc-dependent alcohol dehydrogenase [Streptomyces tsukubensis]QFR97512.1 alcohol dehydrogenase catalytic domain-containing protein [Streptomyces tsukubensis]
MKAAVVRDFGEPMVVEDRPVPTPGPREVLVRMETSGLCRTDIHAARGDWLVRPEPPFVPGHEGVGIVEAAGEEVDSPSVGDRVAIPWLGEACGECDHCADGGQARCPGRRGGGYSMDGTHAEYACAHASCVVPVAAGVDPLDAAPLICAGLTSYRAVRMSGARRGRRVLISGVGGLGHLALQYARILGAETIAVDVSDEKLALARELGADHVIDARTQDVVGEALRLGGAHAALSLALSDEASAVAHAVLCAGGTLIRVAAPVGSPHELPVLPARGTVLAGNHIPHTVRGSVAANRRDLAEVFRLHRLGRTRVVRETRRLEDINLAFREVQEGKVSARVVFDLR